MEFDREEMRRRAELDKALTAQKKLEEQLTELKRKTRSAKSRLESAKKSEQWHRMSLGWLDREAGYTGEMASARVWLRSQSLPNYVELLKPFMIEQPSATNLALEVAAVNANLSDWTARGDAMLLDRAKREYEREVAGFEEWQRSHPGQQGWRAKPLTRAQGLLIERMRAALEITPPARMNCGEAYDWIAQHGGNPRLAQQTHDLAAPAPTAIGGDAQ